jgi:hypothetical protein
MFSQTMLIKIFHNLFHFLYALTSIHCLISSSTVIGNSISTTTVRLICILLGFAGLMEGSISLNLVGSLWFSSGELVWQILFLVRRLS